MDFSNVPLPLAIAFWLPPSSWSSGIRDCSFPFHRAKPRTGSFYLRSWILNFLYLSSIHRVSSFARPLLFRFSPRRLRSSASMLDLVQRRRPTLLYLCLAAFQPPFPETGTSSTSTKLHLAFLCIFLSQSTWSRQNSKPRSSSTRAIPRDSLFLYLRTPLSIKLDWIYDKFQVRKRRIWVSGWQTDSRVAWPISSRTELHPL